VSTEILLVILGAVVSLATSLIIYNLRVISRQIAAQDNKIKEQNTKIKEQNIMISSVADDIKKTAEDLASCKDQCRQQFVDKVDYIREVTKLERMANETIKLLSELNGTFKASMAVIDKMPELCASVASQVVAQMKSHGGPA